MKKRIRLFSLLLVTLIMLPTLAFADTKWVETPNGKSVNMRVGPSMDDAVLTRVPYAAAVDVIYDLLGSSYLHCEYKGYNGYIQARYLADYEPERQGPSPAPTKKPSSGKPSTSISYNKFKPTLYHATVVPSIPRPTSICAGRRTKALRFRTFITTPKSCLFSLKTALGARYTILRTTKAAL